ncbi:MAG: HAD family hydrolase [Bacteroidia bacterium]|nr:MAG: HAD family hydrolase [Bacteroidia bacterium]
MFRDKKFKLIACDIDVTILDNNRCVSTKLIKLVAKLKKRGYLFTLVTARYPLSALKIAKELEISHAIVVLNGSLVTDFEHKIYFSRTFSVMLLKHELEIIEEQFKDVAINYYHDFIWQVVNPNKHTDHECRELGIDYLSNLKLTLSEINKVTFMGEHERLYKIRQKLAKVMPNLEIQFSHSNHLEIVAKDVNKLLGLTHCANLMNIDLNNIMAFGDGENDMPMLAGVGHGVAMDNATLQVKKVASAIAAHHLEEGVALYLEDMINKGWLN